MNIFLDKSPTLTKGEVIEFIKALCRADYEELIYHYDSTNYMETFINEFALASKYTDVYALRRAYDNKVLALGGIAKFNRYGVWLLCTDEAFKHPLSLYKYCMKILRSYHGTLCAYVYKPNKQHINFITKGLGFIKEGSEYDKFALYVLEIA